MTTDRYDHLTGDALLDAIKADLEHGNLTVWARETHRIVALLAERITALEDQRDTRGTRWSDPP